MGLVAKAFQDIITFSRASSGTYVNSNGYITNSSVLNYLTYSNQADNAAWTKSNSFVQTNLLTFSDSAVANYTSVSPTVVNITPILGFANSVRFPDNSATIVAYKSYTTIAGVIYTLSAYVQMDDGTAPVVSSIATAGDLTLVIESNPAPTNITVVSVGGGVYRVQASVTALGGGTNAGIVKYNTQSVKGFKVTGLQLVQGSVPGDYRATTSAALPVLYADYQGVVRARKLCEDATATITHRILPNAAITVDAAGVYTYSWYVKAGELTEARLTDNNVLGATFNLSTGASSSVSAGYTPSAVNLGNGWWRLSISAIAGSVSGRILIYLVKGGTSTYTGDGSSGIYIADAQLNDGSSALAYYDTTASAYNAPRFDYDPVTLAAKGLLIEEQRANLLLNSVLAGTGAAPTSFTQVIGTGTSAPATSTRSAISAAYTQTATAQRPFIAQSVTTVASTVYTVSMNVESVTGVTYADIIGVSGITPSAYRLNGATVTSTDPATVGKLEIVITASGVASECRFGIGISGNATGTVRFSCPQVEVGSFATSYIPTTTSQVTRAADVASVNTLSPWFNAVAGTLYGEADLYNNVSTNVTHLASVNDGSSNNSHRLISYNGKIGGTTQVSGSTVSDLQPLTYTTNTTFKFAYAYAANDFAAVGNGGAPLTDTAGALPTGLNLLGIGYVPSGNFWSGHIRRITYYPRRLTNAELQSLTTL